MKFIFIITREDEIFATVSSERKANKVINNIIERESKKSGLFAAVEDESRAMFCPVIRVAKVRENNEIIKYRIIASPIE